MSFCRKIMRSSMLPNLISAILIFGYSIISSMLLTRKHLSDFIPIIIFEIFITLILMLFLSPVFTRLLFSSMQHRIDAFSTEETNEKTRTRLFEDLMLCPLICSIQTLFLFSAASAVSYFYVRKIISFPVANTLSLLECIYGSIYSALFAYGYCNRICSTYACEIVKSGIDENYVMEKKHFGITLNMQMNVYFVLPAVLSTILANFINIASLITIPFKGFVQASDPSLQIVHMAFACTVNTIVQIVMVLFFYKRIKTSNDKMRTILEQMDESDINSAKYVNTDLEDEVAYTHYLANNMLQILQTTLSQFEEIGKMMKETSMNLSHISTETNATYLEQSSGTTEIVSSMKITAEKAHQVKDRIAEVAKLAKDTESDVQNGTQVLDRYYENIKHIEEHNRETIEGIQELNSRITNIWEVVTIINSIADLTKIIAFNAELESSGIHEKGNNFKNVSNEIRRLANSTVDSTREIKERINIIQDSSEELKSSLEDTLPLIKQGRTLVEQLKNNFENILASTNKNAESAGQVSGLVSEQTSAFESISNTLQEINSGLENFEEATATISRSSQELQKSAMELENISTSGAENE